MMRRGASVDSASVAAWSFSDFTHVALIRQVGLTHKILTLYSSDPPQLLVPFVGEYCSPPLSHASLE